MERQDFINTINELRSTIESLRMTIATLQRTIESLNADEKRHKKQVSEYEEKIAALIRQCEYLESLNKRHYKNRFCGKTLSQKNRTENKRKSRDEQEPDYMDPSSHDDSGASDKVDAGTDASHGGDASELDQTKVKSEGLNESRGSRGSYEKMDAAETIVLKSKVDGAPSNWKFLKFKDVDEYTKVSYVRKTTFKVAVFVDEYGVYHEYYSPEDPEDDRRPCVNVIPGTHCRIENECILARMTPDKIKERRNKKDVDDILKRLYRKACEYLNHKKKHYSKMTQDVMKYMKNGWKDLIRLFFTLCETCKNFSVNFKEYVAYAAKELISGNTDYESLAPWAIKLV